MKSYYSDFVALLIILLSSSMVLADDWVKTSDPPLGVNQFKVEIGTENGNDIQFLLESSGLGLFKSTDNGTTWENIGLEGKGITAIVDHWFSTHDGEHIVSTSDGVYKTTDGGTNWQHYTTGIEGLFITDIIHFLTLNELAIGTVGHGVFYSTDGGETWQQMGVGLENKTVTSLKFQFDGQQSKVYATTQEDGVFVLIGGNNNWIPINDGNPSLFNNTAIAVNHPDKLFLTNYNSGIHSSPSDPVFWQVEINFEFANDIVAIPDGKVFASSFGDGIIVRDLNGNWTDFSIGLPVDPDGYIDMIDIGRNINFDWSENTQTEEYLWAAYVPLHPSMTPGIYRTVNPVSDVEDNKIVTPEDFKLEQNYPNPFNPSTTINYSVSNSAFITIKIYDVLGNQIAELVNEEKPIGVHEVSFNASNLSTGTYFYQLQAVSTSSNSGESFVETKKMILIK